MKIERINLNKDLRIDYACSKDTLKPTMQLIHFENDCIYATNAHIAVRNDLHECSSLKAESIERLNGKNIHNDMYKHLLRYNTIEIEESGIRAFNDVGFVFLPFIEAEYPDVESIIERALQSPEIQLTRIGLNLKHLTNLYKSLYNSEESILEFNIYNQVVLRNPSELTKTVGIMMYVN